MVGGIERPPVKAHSTVAAPDMILTRWASGGGHTLVVPGEGSGRSIPAPVR